MMQQRSRSFLRVVAIAAASLALGVPQALALPSDAGWTALRDERGTSVQYPREVFPVDAGEGTPQGRMFATSDGRARLHVFAIRNERAESPQQFLRRVFPKNRGRLSYDRVTGTFFAVSQPTGARILYRRCNFPGDGIIRCVDLQYPRSEKRAWDGIVTRVSLSLRPR